MTVKQEEEEEKEEVWKGAVLERIVMPNLAEEEKIKHTQSCATFFRWYIDFSHQCDQLVGRDPKVVLGRSCFGQACVCVKRKGEIQRDAFFKDTQFQ